MSKRLLLFVCLVSFFIFSCKSKTGEDFPGKGIVVAPQGASLLKTPGGSSLGITIPFIEEMDIVGKKTDKGKSHFKVKLNGKEGWAESETLCPLDGLKKALLSEFKKTGKNYSADFRIRVEKSEFAVKKVYRFPGGDMPESTMVFFSDGIMVLASGIFSRDMKLNFFTYEFTGGGKLLKITFQDSSVKFEDMLEVEAKSSSLFKTDKQKREIIYHITDDSFFFLNWKFSVK